jgi:hypothetical protein
VHTVALGVTPLALLALFLPPRRLDARAVILGGVALWGTNQIAHDYTGKSFAQRFSSRMQAMSGTELPEKAKITQIRLREEKERKAKLQALRDEMVRSGGGSAETATTAAEGPVEGWSEEQKKALLEAYETLRRDNDGKGKGEEEKKGVIEKIWMGNASPDWKEKRDRKEQEALQEGGGGYWGLITDQLAEVWSGGKKDEGEASKEKSRDEAKKA